MCQSIQSVLCKCNIISTSETQLFVVYNCLLLQETSCTPITHSLLLCYRLEEALNNFYSKHSSDTIPWCPHHTLVSRNIILHNYEDTTNVVVRNFKM